MGVGEGVLVRKREDYFGDLNFRLFFFLINIFINFKSVGFFKLKVRIYRWISCGFVLKVVEGRKKDRGF